MKLTESNLKILKLKFKRYNIVFSYAPDSGDINIGKTKYLNQKLILGISGITLAVVFLISIVLLNLPFGRVINYFFAGGVGLFGLKKLGEYLSAKETNAEKTIHLNGISINNNFYSCDEILDIYYQIEFVEDGNSIGQLYISTIKKREKFITLIEKEYIYLKNDLDFFKKFIVEHLEITLVKNV